MTEKRKTSFEIKRNEEEKIELSRRIVSLIQHPNLSAKDKENLIEVYKNQLAS